MEQARDEALGGLTAVMEDHDLPLGILDTVLSEVEHAIEDPADIIAAMSLLVERLAAAGSDTEPVEVFGVGLAQKLEAMMAEPNDAPSDDAVPGRRLVQHIILRKRESEWVSNEAFIRNLSGQGPWLAELTPTQRSTLGFPPAGHKFWQQPTALSQMIGRYPSLDPEPYLAAGAAPLAPASYGEGLESTGASSTTELGLYPPPPNRMALPVETVEGLPDGLVLTPEQVRQFREEGYLLIHGIWPQELVDRAVDAMRELHPNKAAGEPDAPPSRGVTRAGQFPYHNSVLNEMNLHPRFLTAVGQLLDVPEEEIRLTQSMVGAKQGTETPDPAEVAPKSWMNPRGDQPIHLDFGNNTVLFPARSAGHWGAPEDVQGIPYFTNWEESGGGGTTIVPGLRHSIDSRLDAGIDDPAELLYDNELQVGYSKGSILLYQLGTWHRGTPVQLGGMRRSGHFCFRTAEADWVGGDVGVGAPTAKAVHQLSVDAEVPEFEADAFLSGLSPAQRCTIGFPKVGSRYWTEETIAATAERYPTMDMSPYVEGLREAGAVAVAAVARL